MILSRNSFFKYTDLYYMSNIPRDWVKKVAIEISFLLLSQILHKAVIMFLVARFPIFFIVSSYFIYFHLNRAKYSRNLPVGLSTRFLLLSSSLASLRGLSRWSDLFSSSCLFSIRCFSLSLANPLFLRLPLHSSLVLQTGRPKETSNVALSSLSIWADSVELPSSKVRASNEAINKSTALTGLSTLFVRDDVSILKFFSCLRVHEVGPIFSILVERSSSPPSRTFRWLDCRRLNRVFPRFFV